LVNDDEIEQLERAVAEGYGRGADGRGLQGTGLVDL